MVFSGLVTDWRLATWPTRRLPSFANATTEGVVRPPSEFVITVGSPPSMTATTEFVVPKSMPIILLISRILHEVFIVHRRQYGFLIRRKRAADGLNASLE